MCVKIYGIALLCVCLCLYMKMYICFYRNTRRKLSGRQDAEGNVLLRATNAAEKLIKVSSLRFMSLITPRQKELKSLT